MFQGLPNLFIGLIASLFNILTIYDISTYEFVEIPLPLKLFRSLSSA
jgi:hypothetical protein